MRTSKNIRFLILSMVLFFSCFITVNTAKAVAYDTTRIYKAMAKARAGEDIVVGVIGGSITNGTAASTESKRYANLVADWWETKFPAVNVTLVNAGIGGTGSDIGTFRVKKDLLSKEPDFIVVEFSVNDAEGALAEKTMEGLVRQILSDTNYPGAMLLLLKQSNGTTAQVSHKLVANYYGVPYISFADMIDTAVSHDGISLASIFTDGLHPNDVGMTYIAEFINRELESIYNNLPADEQIPPVNTTLAVPRVTDVYAHTYSYNSTTIIPATNNGWTLSSDFWTSSTPGSEISFEVDGNSVAVLYSRHNYADGGRVEIWVDNGPKTTLDAYWDQTWGPATVFSLIEEGLADGQHTLHIKVLAEHSSASNGNYFKLINVLKAGNISGAAPIALTNINSKKVLTGDLVSLNGSTSFDPDGDAIVSYAWSIVSAPGTSSAVITSPGSTTASFTPDVQGYYTIGLIVNDGTANSIIKKVNLHAVASNNKPIANAGEDFNFGTYINDTLNGSASSDPDGDILTYLWTFLSKPTDSYSFIEKNKSVNPIISYDKQGEYKIILIVNDSLENSDPDTLTITAISGYTGITSPKYSPEYQIDLYPNPASSTIFLDYTLDKSQTVKILAYSTEGKIILELYNQVQSPGKYHQELELEALNLPETTLVFKINIGDTSIIKHVIYQN